MPGLILCLKRQTSRMSAFERHDLDMRCRFFVGFLFTFSLSVCRDNAEPASDEEDE